MSKAEAMGAGKAALSGSAIQPVRTRISCHCEDASEVFLAGTFNGWNPQAIPMTKQSHDEWVAEVDLIPGSYEYKFVIDGKWRCESAGDNIARENCVPNSFGTMNRRLYVS
jgi:1,4-alpha-glucan branching enzyme